MSDIFAFIKPQPWTRDAACRDTLTPDIWFNGTGYLGGGESPATRDAIAICNECKVQAECLQYALDNDEKQGVWGGLTPLQRRVIRTRQRQEGVA